MLYIPDFEYIVGNFIENLREYHVHAQTVRQLDPRSFIRSLIYNTHNVGEIMLPCLVPWSASNHSDDTPFIHTNNFSY